ncbi:ABC transporter ATP-binding protein [Acetobacterium woodii]|uniref:Iron chelating ABC transport system ATP-binding protein n=1 Tax=Acetobacterium woodii (strain ATCC 29683 / DSM 1030 / JCM 2381 / KCTC 1655 / WB1) TaxID=931626 RepID=H6LF00_ACEWD|nr:ABC transporter ATP-binding protein [Acetobacterium woodii]AFA46906.1 iron chelating ABC transport system ATP-binding protein [Acetobacterium woodii DSM 1030]
MSLKIENMSYAYGDHKVLDKINFEIPSGALTCILGANGIGKSTLFRCILRLNDDYTGHCYLNGLDAKLLSIQELAKQIAYIPQSHAPAFNYKVIEIVLMSTTAQMGNFKGPGDKEKKVAMEALERVGMAAFAEQGYTQISGGERQLVLIARALAQQTKIIIMDEPTSNLDYGNQIRILSKVKQLTREGYTIIQSTHHPDQAFMYADEVIVLEKGNLIHHGTPKEIISEPMIQKIYHINVEINSLYDDLVRVTIPIDEITNQLGCK